MRGGCNDMLLLLLRGMRTLCTSVQELCAISEEVLGDVC